MGPARVCRVCGGEVDSAPTCGNICKRCDRLRYKAWGARQPRRALWIRARTRARRKGILFMLTVDDIPEIPERCPIIGVPLIWGTNWTSPSLDRVVNDLGYVPGNVRIISWLANALKSNATFETIEKLYLYMKGEKDGR